MESNSHGPNEIDYITTEAGPTLFDDVRHQTQPNGMTESWVLMCNRNPVSIGAIIVNLYRFVDRFQMTVCRVTHVDTDNHLLRYERLCSLNDFGEQPGEWSSPLPEECQSAVKFAKAKSQEEPNA